MSQYNESYYSGGGGGGGGYIAGSPFSQAGSPGARQRTEVGHSLRPMTICQLNKATQPHTDAEWRIDETEIGQVTVVAQVLQISPQATNCVYTLDDGTGRIEARHWVDNASETNAQKWAGLKENMYVRVTGGLKSFGSKRYINALHVRPVTDAFEVFFHQLEVITVTLTIERGAPTAAIQTRNKDVVMSDISAYSAPSTSRPSDQYSHLPKLPQAICQFMLEQPGTAEGVHVSAIARAVGNIADAGKISEALDGLMDDGLVYTTTDDSHFQLAN